MRRRTTAARSRAPLAALLTTFELLASVFLIACHTLSTEAPGALVPPTADQDPSLPRLLVRVAGRDRMLHLQTFGDPANPPLFVVPGGPGADFRLLLPLRALADRYHVVMWDPRGAGLSERVTEAELTRDSFDDEIAAVHATLAPGRPVALVGHSEGAALVLRYAARHADAVAFVGLIEPAPITANARRHYHGGFPSFDAVEDFFWQNELLTSSDHAAADYKALTLVPNASAGFTCNGRPPPDDPMWRFGAFHHHVLTHGAAAPTGDFSWADGIDAYRGPLVLLAGSCGDAGASFQRAYNLPAIPRADVRVIEGAGHISLFIDYANATVDVLRTVLPAYGAGGRGQ